MIKHKPFITVKKKTYGQNGPDLHMKFMDRVVLDLETRYSWLEDRTLKLSLGERLYSTRRLDQHERWHRSSIQEIGLVWSSIKARL